ncbi:MAG: tRNA (guanosine(37)-N1)-methyltransferase TrmD, partial [Bacteroidia bacterium]
MESPLNHSIVQRAKDKGIVEIVLHDLKDYGLGKYKQVDDTVYGGGAGMVIRCEPVFDCIEKLQA